MPFFTPHCQCFNSRSTDLHSRPYNAEYLVGEQKTLNRYDPMSVEYLVVLRCIKQFPVINTQDFCEILHKIILQRLALTGVYLIVHVRN